MKIYVAGYFYHYYDGEGYGMAGTEDTTVGYFSDLNKAIESVNNAKIEEKAGENLDWMNYGNDVTVYVNEITVDEEFCSNRVYEYHLRKEATGDKDHWGSDIYETVRFNGELED